MADLDQHLRATRVLAVALIGSLVIYLDVALVDGGLIRLLRRALLAPKAGSDFHLFLALSLGLFAIYVPRRDQWNEWARQMAPRA